MLSRQVSARSLKSFLEADVLVSIRTTTTDDDDNDDNVNADDCADDGTDVATTSGGVRYLAPSGIWHPNYCSNFDDTKKS